MHRDLVDPLPLLFRGRRWREEASSGLPLRWVPAIVLLGVIPACSVNSVPADPAPEAVACTEPRPEACTREYCPVCAERDNGVRCVTTPCDSTEQKTYSNGCTACSDPLVYSYEPDACPNDASD